MNPATSTTLVLGLVALLAVAGPAGASRSEVRERSTARYDAAGIRQVEVDNSRGFVEIVAGAPGEIRLEALKLVKGSADAQARALSAKTLVEAGPEGQRLVIHVRYPTGRAIRIDFWDLFQGVEIPRTEVRLLLHVPAGMTVEATTASGDIHTRGLTGEQRIKSTSGDLEIQGAAGAVRASTTSGDLLLDGGTGATLQTVSGDVTVGASRGALVLSTVSGSISVADAASTVAVESVSGDVTIRSAVNGLRASSTSGDVVVRRASGQIEASASSGDLEVALVGPLRSATLETGSGNLRVRLAHGLACAIDMNTSSGAIDVRAPMDLHRVTRTRVTGSVRGGQVPIGLRSSSGDIVVTSEGS